MILGIGTDIVEVARLEDRISNLDFLKLVFTANEISYCMQGLRSAERFAARFAAKEAFFKALGTGLSGDMEFIQAEVTNNEDGRPLLILTGAALQKTKEMGVRTMHLSLSHEKKYATAFVILES